ncbi:MAG: tetratricopeptide repeat protein [Winogradskyella sp.]|nr:tetratricopeptide repeat protein [Winogradskyella sp.]
MEKRILYILFLLVIATSSALSQNQEVLADNYYKRGEYQKALIIYKSIFSEKPYNFNYLYKIIDTHQQLEQFEEAKQVINSWLNKVRTPMVIIELGYNYQLQDSLDLAKSYYNEVIAYVDEKPNYIYSIARKFEEHSLLNEAIEVYNKGKLLAPDKNFNLQLARIYGDQGNIEKMFDNYLGYISYKPNFLNNAKRSMADFISEDNTAETNKILRTLLLKKIQAQPDTYWYDLLSWLYVQERSYDKSFVQEKALYRRNPESLDRIIELALTAINDNENEVATSILNYITETTQDLSTFLIAKQYLLDIETKASKPKNYDAIDKSYNALFDTYGITELTLELQIAYANFLAFYLNDTEKANQFLKQSLNLDVNAYQKAKVKLKLADILVLQEKFNEALIFYSQIQTSLKNSTISQEARFKVAKTSYYKGDFDWAETQLKILKSSTSQLIANDALELKLLISDNKYEDSTQTALRYYAKADLLAFQNKNVEAIKLLDKILEDHKGESIEDQALFKQAKLYESQQLYAEAEANYKYIIDNYRDDILADDAYFYLAELYANTLNRPEEAKPLYEKIIFDYQDSIYFIDARKKFRMLRGDNIN